MIMAIGYPVLYLELIIGQYHRCSPVVFLRRCVPILQGFGYLALVSSITTIYPYQYSVSRAFKFIVSFATSQSRTMPWSTCGNPWNTEDCYEFYNENCPDLKSGHIVFRRECVNGSTLQGSYVESAEEQYVVHKTGLTHMSFTNFDYGVAYSIFILWLSIAFVQNRTGTKTSSMIYVPTIFVFLICPFLFLRALHLDGATNGIKEMFRVEWAELLYSKIWMDALSLVMQSLSLGIGGHSIMASLAPAEKYTFQVATSAVILDTSLSLITTGTVFSIFGFIAFMIGKDSVYDITNIPSGVLLTHSTVPVLLRNVAKNAWLWVFLYYLSLIIVGWKSCSLVLKTISVTIADIFHFSSKTFVFDIFSMMTSVILACFGLFLCYEGGPLYITMINDIQKLITGIFITAQLLIILEFYGLDVLYEDMHSLIGQSSNRHWSKAYSWAIWKWRWRMAPAFSFIYALSAFFRVYPSSETDLEYNHSYYDILQFFFIICILILPLLFSYYAYLKMFHYMEYHKKNFNFNILWKPQRFLRSWSNIQKIMKKEERRFSDEYLPEMEPEDSTGFWNKVYSPLSAPTVTKEETLIAPMDKPIKKPKMSTNELKQQDALSFDNYLKKLQEKNEIA